MAWTEKQRKEHSKRMKAMWAKKAEAKWGKSVGVNPEYQAVMNQRARNQLDMVNHPAHYTFSKFEVADVSDEWFPHEPLLWNANKYTARWDKKGDPIENLEKAIWYLNRKINQLKEQRDAQV